MYTFYWISKCSSSHFTIFSSVSKCGELYSLEYTPRLAAELGRKDEDLARVTLDDQHVAFARVDRVAEGES